MTASGQMNHDRRVFQYYLNADLKGITNFKRDNTFLFFKIDFSNRIFLMKLRTLRFSGLQQSTEKFSSVEC